MKKITLILSLIFCHIVFADDQQPPPTQPATNQPVASAPAQTSPNITIAPSSKDVENADKLFKDATFDNFTPQPEQPFIDADNLNNSN